MANRNFNRLQALDKEIKHIYGQFTIASTTQDAVFDQSTGTDAAAALTNRQASVGVKSISWGDPSVGIYKITLGAFGGDSDLYPEVKFFEAITTSTPPASTISTYGGALWTLSGNTVSTDGILTAYGLNVSGAGAAFRAGDTVKFHIVLKNSNQPGVGVS